MTTTLYKTDKLQLNPESPDAYGDTKEYSDTLSNNIINSMPKVRYV